MRFLLTFQTILGFGAFLSTPIVQAEENDPRNRVTATPIPEWVEVSEVIRPENVPTEELNDGVYYLSLENQVQVEEAAEYQRTVELVTSSDGTEISSEVMVNFDPAFQTVEFHRIRIYRDGRILDRLEPEEIRILEREEDMESRILDGSLTAFCLLEDVRVGDIVESAYTVHGRNPAFEGRYYDSFSIGWSVPLGHQLVRILFDPKRSIQSRTVGEAREPERRASEDGLTEVRWEQHDPPPIHGDSNVPHFHTIYPWLQVSETADWQSVATWAARLYEGDFELPAELEARVALIDEMEIPQKEKTGKLLQLVQEDIRYLGVEMGTGAYHPRAPQTVYDRRFGDCKDKTLLLHTLLSRIGIKSTPALVNTSDRGGVENWLPAPTAFNHVILSVDLEGDRYWLDPTRSYQRGPLESRGIPGYGFALLASPTETGLTEIKRQAATRYEATVFEKFETSGVNDPVDLTVRSTYDGFAAEQIRRYFGTKNRESIGKSYTEYYADDYPDIELLHPVAFEDDPERNRCTTVEHYRIGKLWKQEDEESVVWKANIYPSFVADQLYSPSSSRRKTPYALRYPRKVSHEIEVHLWEEWKDSESDTQVTDDAFRFEKSMRTRGSLVKISHEYEALNDHVPAGAIAGYHGKIEKIRNKLNWTFTSSTADSSQEAAAPEKNFELSVPTIAISVIAVMLSVVGGVGFSLFPRKKPPLMIPPDADRYEGLGGWLILPQIGLWLMPFIMYFSLAPLVTWGFDGNEWNSMRTVVGEGEFPALQALIYGQLTLEVVMGIAAIFLLLHFYQRRFFAPTALIVLFLAGILDTGLDLALVSIRNDIAPGVVGEAERSFMRSIGSCVIWVPYLLVSKRVKATFRF